MCQKPANYFTLSCPAANLDWQALREAFLADSLMSRWSLVRAKSLAVIPFLVLAVIAPLSAPADDPLAWPPITAQSKPWTFWWWMGSAVDKTNLTKELERYAAAGIGGVHIIPIYGATGWEEKYIKYLSPEWMDRLGWAVSEAHRLGGTANA